MRRLRWGPQDHRWGPRHPRDHGWGPRALRKAFKMFYDGGLAGFPHDDARTDTAHRKCPEPYEGELDGDPDGELDGVPDGDLVGVLVGVLGVDLDARRCCRSGSGSRLPSDVLGVGPHPEDGPRGHEDERRGLLR